MMRSISPELNNLGFLDSTGEIQGLTFILNREGCDRVAIDIHGKRAPQRLVPLRNSPARAMSAPIEQQFNW